VLKSTQPNRVKTLACICLAHLANLRQSVFEMVDQRIAYVHMFVVELISYLHSHSMSDFSCPKLYKEFLNVILKL
jgi:hypothetical protein